MRLPTFKTWEIGLFSIILVIGGFLRFYHLPQTLLFLGDQGRDAIIAKQILKDRDIALIGPVTSVGNMYLGPFYYYFMVPFLALTYPDPVGPALGVALINTLSVLGLFLIARQLFNSKIAFLAMGIYAIMPLAVQFSRFSWNPNLGAPVAVLIFWLLVRWMQNNHWKYAVGLGLALGIIVQLHYVALITWGVVALNWLLLMVQGIYSRRRIFVQGLAIAGLALSLLTPLVVFDFRHNHIISAEFQSFFTSSEAHMQPWTRLTTIVRETEGRMYQVLSQLVSGEKNPTIDRLVGYISIVLLAWIFLTRRNKNTSIRSPEYVMVEWLFLTIVGIAFYSSSVFNHYLTFCFPIVALYWAFLIYNLWKRHLVEKMASSIVLVGILIICAVGIKEIHYSGVGTARIQQTVKEILPRIERPYNLALIAANGDFQGMNYRYFLSVSPKPPQLSDDYFNLIQLVVIDEINNGNPFSVPAFEIQAPRLTNLESSFDIPDGPHVYIYR